MIRSIEVITGRQTQKLRFLIREGRIPKMGMIHGGRLVAKALKQEGVEVVFTLSGGHIAAIYVLLDPNKPYGRSTNVAV